MATEISIVVGDDGSLSVEMETAAQEAAENQTEGGENESTESDEDGNSVPAKDAKDALRIAGQMLSQVLSSQGGGTEDKAMEQAYQAGQQ